MANTKKQILVIEDENALSTPLVILLESKGVSVVLAKDGEEALATLKNTTPDMILLDLVLPRLNGFKVLEEIKTNPSTKHVPVIIISNLGSSEDMKRGESLGAKHYFVKSRMMLNDLVDYVISEIKKEKSHT